ncbi:MAG: hypothetical protein ABIO43_06935 [Sphingomicrobium sp.]
MTGPGEVMMAIIFIGLPILGFVYLVHRVLRHHERKLELRAEISKACQHQGSESGLEQRVRVLEQIVTDRGAETAAQIEALRTTPRLTNVD